MRTFWIPTYLEHNNRRVFDTIAISALIRYPQEIFARAYKFEARPSLMRSLTSSTISTYTYISVHIYIYNKTVREQCLYIANI